MIPQCWCRERKERGRKEHGFIVGMGNQEANALVAQLGTGGATQLRGVEPACHEENGDGEKDR